MRIPIEITFRDMESSPSLIQRIHEAVDKLGHVFQPIVRCSVVIESPHKHQQRGRKFHVLLAIAVPGHDITVSHDSDPEDSHDDAHIAVADAFRSARRQLAELARLRRDVRASAP